MKEIGILSTKAVMFHLFGPVEASVDGVRVGLGTEQERRMVVPLLLSIRRPVSYLELADWMWDGSTGAPDDLGRYMGDFRARLSQLGLRGALVNRDRVCRLNLVPEQVDVRRLGTVLAEVDVLDDETAAARLRDVLALCAGEPLAGLAGHRIDSARQQLLAQRLLAERILASIDFRLGRDAYWLPDPDLPVSGGGLLVATDTMSVSMYLSDEAASAAVEAAVEATLARAGLAVVERNDPVLGSWFRKIKASEVGAVAAHAVNSRLVLAQDAQVASTLLQNLGPVITALQPVKEAVVRMGTVLIVKLDDKVLVHQLTAAQQLQLDHQPELAMAPREILTALRVTPAQQADGTHTFRPSSRT